MFGLDNLTHYSRRALAERDKAATSPTLAISAIHQQLAEHYEARVAEIEARPPLRLVSSEVDSSPQLANAGGDADEAAAQKG
jgi:hypothetical protein